MRNEEMDLFENKIKTLVKLNWQFSYFNKKKKKWITLTDGDCMQINSHIEAIKDNKFKDKNKIIRLLALRGFKVVFDKNGKSDSGILNLKNDTKDLTKLKKTLNKKQYLPRLV